MKRPVALDLCCGQGGASKGLVDAGLDVVGVDILPQPYYPWTFVQADLVDVLADTAFVRRFAFVWASVPCQFASHMQNTGNMRTDHPNLIPITRAGLRAAGVPYVIENVTDAVRHLESPILLCGAMFGLQTYRHRWFEVSPFCLAPPHPAHTAPSAKVGRRAPPGHMVSLAGHFAGVVEARTVLGTPWMTQDGMAQAIPPIYSWYLARQILGRQLQ
jgi:DNA (cytosine-5)-methyltransferase 1